MLFLPGNISYSLTPGKFRNVCCYCMLLYVIKKKKKKPARELWCNGKDMCDPGQGAFAVYHGERLEVELGVTPPRYTVYSLQSPPGRWLGAYTLSPLSLILRTEMITAPTLRIVLRLK